MIDAGYVRTSINQHVHRIRRAFRWGVAQEMVPVSVYEALRSVEALSRGRSRAKEPEPVAPVLDAQVDAVTAMASRQVAAMIRLQRFTAARPGDVVILRPGDVDRQGRIWIYKPARHKTEHLGHAREVYLGPKAQGALRPFLLRPADAFCFSPREAEAERRERRHAERVTPGHRGNRPGTNRKRRPKVTPGERYTVASYRKAIRRACEAAEVEVWTPHRLRHTAGTRIRKAFGLDVAQAVLGHRSARVTEVYAEVSRAKAVDAMMEIG